MSPNQATARGPIPPTRGRNTPVKSENEGFTRASAPPIGREVTGAGVTPNETRAPRVLLGSSDESYLKTTREALKEAGYRVEIALDSVTVMASLEPRRYDLAILDTGLVEIDGLSIFDRLRTEPDGRDLYLIALADPNEKPLGAPVGPDDCITKPFEIDDLLTSVHIGTRICTLQRELGFANQRISTLAMTDALTGLPNRQAIYDMLGTEIARQSRQSPPSCLALIDIDRMREINDAYGRPGGDLAVLRVARNLRSTAREADTVGRLGDDKFVIVLYDCAPEDSAIACDRLCESIEHEPLIMPDGEVHLSVACGVVALDPDISAVETLDAARAALHTAKARGVNHVALEAKFREAWF
jgi:two-component system cell cycle response regulator